jgi:hypothetical protein
MGLWDTISDIGDELIGGLEDVADGLAAAAEWMYEGVAPIAGVLVSGTAFVIAGPMVMVPAFVAGAVASKALIRHRRLEPEEVAVARSVYGDGINYDRILLTNFTGIGGAAFVMESLSGDVLMNIGSHIDDPLGAGPGAYLPEHKLFIHEMAHVWQLERGSYYPRLCNRLTEGVLEGTSYYVPPPDMRHPWPSLNMEQEATLVDEWYAPYLRGPNVEPWRRKVGDVPPPNLRMRPDHPFYPYVRDVIRLVDHPESVNGVPIYGAIVVKWRRLGGLQGFLGKPLAAEGPGADGVGRRQDFEGGSICWHPRAGAFSVRGNIAHRWREIGAETFGYPINDELATPDGRGRYNHFRPVQYDDGREASIYWTEATGAVEVYGAIRMKWAELGWERSSLGYPLRPEESVGDTGQRWQRFEGGFLVWSAARGVWFRKPLEAVITSTSITRRQWLYLMSADGQLYWKGQLPRRVGRPQGEWSAPVPCGTGWNAFGNIVTGGGQVLYAHRYDGIMVHYEHLGSADGSFQWTAPVEVGGHLRGIHVTFGGGQGVVYTVEPDGRLIWRRHIGLGDEPISDAWTTPTVVGSGWTMFSRIFAMGNGVLYGVTPSGELHWYRHLGHLDGQAAWAPTVKVNVAGWAYFTQIVGLGAGHIAALTPDRRLLRYIHEGWETGDPNAWQPAFELDRGLGEMARMVGAL